MKRRIHHNVWGNWKAYLGTKCVHDFGLDETDAKEWVVSGQWIGVVWVNGTPKDGVFTIENGRVVGRETPQTK